MNPHTGGPGDELFFLVPLIRGLTGTTPEKPHVFQIVSAEIERSCFQRSSPERREKRSYPQSPDDSL